MPTVRPAAVPARANLVSSLVAKVQTIFETNADVPKVRKALTRKYSVPQVMAKTSSSFCRAAVLKVRVLALNFFLRKRREWPKRASTGLNRRQLVGRRTILGFAEALDCRLPEPGELTPPLARARSDVDARALARRVAYSLSSGGLARALE